MWQPVLCAVLSNSTPRQRLRCARCLPSIWQRPPPRMPPASIRDRLPNIIDGCTVGAGHFNQLEVPDQVDAMIEAFLRHYV